MKRSYALFQFQAIVRLKLKLQPAQVLYLVFPSGTIYSGGMNRVCDPVEKLMAEIYDKERDADGFLYVRYGGEKYTGARCC